VAIKRVTSYKGKRTAGVDKVIWTTSKQKTDAVGTLKRKGYWFIKKAMWATLLK
jgi:RNA-directed DNA polymerase